MKIYANRYGMIESTELAFALRAEEQRRRAAADLRQLRDERRAERRRRWHAAVETTARLVAGVRAGAARAAAADRG